MQTKTSNKSPLTTAQKQSRRRAALNDIARAAGWKSWDEYSTAVKRGVVLIAKNPPVKRAA